jgi:hypothetical protein
MLMVASYRSTVKHADPSAEVAIQASWTFSSAATPRSELFPVIDGATEKAVD